MILSRASGILLVLILPGLKRNFLKARQCQIELIIELCRKNEGVKQLGWLFYHYLCSVLPRLSMRYWLLLNL